MNLFCVLLFISDDFLNESTRTPLNSRVDCLLVRCSASAMELANRADDARIGSGNIIKKNAVYSVHSFAITLVIQRSSPSNCFISTTFESTIKKKMWFSIRESTRSFITPRRWATVNRPATMYEEYGWVEFLLPELTILINEQKSQCKQHEMRSVVIKEKRNSWKRKCVEVSAYPNVKRQLPYLQVAVILFSSFRCLFSPSACHIHNCTMKRACNSLWILLYQTFDMMKIRSIPNND